MKAATEKDRAAALRILGILRPDVVAAERAHPNDYVAQMYAGRMTREEVNAAMREDLKTIMRSNLSAQERTTVSRVRG